MQNINLVFMGSPETAVTILDALVSAGYSLSLVVTQTDKPTGRGQTLQSPPVKVYADQKGLKTIQPIRLKDESVIEAIREVKPKAIIVAAYGKIIPKEILEIPEWGSINVHFSLLPKYRGASCVSSAIKNGDQETGVTIMQVVEKLDAGPVYLQKNISIENEDTTESLEKKLSQIGGKLLLQTLENIQKGEAALIEQDVTKMTYAPLIRKEEARIDWSRSAEEIERMIRAFIPWPIAYTVLSGKRVQVYQAELILHDTTVSPGMIMSLDSNGLLVATGKNALLLKEIKPESKKRMRVAEIIKGDSSTFQVGKRFE